MAKFFERNKKKSLLAALLLFIRQRKALSLLLLVVMLASTLIATPSYLLIDLPGGARLVAGVAWIAGKAGVDTSGWGLGGKSSFRDLMTVFRQAKTAGASRSVGWGTFFGRAPEGAVPNSLDMVKGSRQDLESPVKGVKGVMTPEDAKASREGDGVAISEGDLTGQRQEGFFGGMMKGLFGSGGSNAELSGGAFVSKGFFSGSAGASNRDRAQAGLDSVGKVNVPKSRASGAASGRLSTLHAAAVNTRAMAGSKAARSLGNHLALTQLAEGKGRATLATEECQPPACPHEFAATQTGAIYDGNTLGDRGLLSGAADIPPSVPSDDPGGAGDATHLAECSKKVQQCQKDKAEPTKRLGEYQTELNNLLSRMPGACGDHCNCGPCNDLDGQIRSVCDNKVKPVLVEIDKPCDLPDYCATLGITDPSTAAAGASRDLCKTDLASCDCGFWCGVGCFFGS